MCGNPVSCGTHKACTIDLASEKKDQGLCWEFLCGEKIRNKFTKSSAVITFIALWVSALTKDFVPWLELLTLFKDF